MSKEIMKTEKIAWARKKVQNSVCAISDQILWAYQYRILRRICFRLCDKLEGGRFFSQTHREIISKYYNVNVGRYSYGPSLDPGALPRGTIVGSYCSFGSELNIFRRNHPADTLTQHPFFYNKHLGIVDEDTIPLDEDNPLTIGHDVWIGSRTTILPGCKRIGNGAIIGANSVVTKDVEDFSINGGNPARMIKKRFSSEIEEVIQKSEWWNLSLPELMKAGDLLVKPVAFEELCTFANNIEDGIKPS